MALRGSEADCACEFTYNNACLFVHVNHFTFYPITVLLLNDFITAQSNRSFLKLYTKPDMVHTWHYQNFRGTVPARISWYVTLTLLRSS